MEDKLEKKQQQPDEGLESGEELHLHHLHQTYYKVEWNVSYILSTLRFEQFFILSKQAEHSISIRAMSNI